MTDDCVFFGRGWCTQHQSWDCASAPGLREAFAPEPRKPKPLIYVSGSMRERECIIDAAKWVESLGYNAFVDWCMPGEQTDDKWQEMARALGQDYLTALDSPHAHDVYDFDRKWLDRSDALVAIGPFGKSGFAEIGYMAGKGKPAAVLLPDADPDRYDIMLLFASLITKSREEIAVWLKNVTSQR